MAIADTITSMQNHTSNAYTMIGYGTDLTGINKNLENLSTSIKEAFLEALRNPDTLFTNLPKKSGSGANITLNDTANAPMRITLGASEIEQRNIPNEYQQVDYIQTTGTQYIDTGVYLKPNTKVNSVMEFTSSSDARWFGDLYNIIAINGVKLPVRVGMTWYDSYNEAISINTKYNVELDLLTTGFNFYTNSTLQVSSQTTTAYTETTYTAYLGSVSNASMRRGSPSFKLYSFKLEQSGVLIRDMIPCYRKSDNVIGLYDIVNDEFYINEGTGSFTYGAVATPTPSSPQDIHTISGSNKIQIKDNNDIVQEEADIDLGDIEYCKIGTYADEFIRSNDGTWQLEENIRKKVLDGTENWQLETNATNYYEYKYYFPISSSANISSHFDGTTNSKITIAYNYLYLRFPKSAGIDVSSVELFKTWLSTNNVTMFYTVATPTYTDITGTLAEQLENVYKNMLSQEGQTNISQVNNDLAFNMNVSAIEE